MTTTHGAGSPTIEQHPDDFARVAATVVACALEAGAVTTVIGLVRVRRALAELVGEVEAERLMREAGNDN